jgi:hypothetical protein
MFARWRTTWQWPLNYWLSNKKARVQAGFMKLYVR